MRRMKTMKKKIRMTVQILAALCVLTIGFCAKTEKAEAANGYIISGSDTRYLTSGEISGMSAQVICYAKNELYARHGRLFESDELQNYFDGQSWYYGYVNPDSFSPSVFNKYETANVDLLSKREAELVRGGYALDVPGYSYDPVYAYSEGGVIYSSSSNSSYIFADSDRRYLNQSEVNALTLQAICYAKNEIYARHGRMFVSQELTDYFNTKSWYYGSVYPENFSPSVFNTYETANIDLLNNTEQARQAGGYVLDQPGYNIYAVGTAGNSTGSEFIFYDSDSRYLSDAEVNSLSCQMACYAKNEIYARHGRMFVSQELNDYFNSKSWYYGTILPDNFSASVFNKYENANIEALKNREFSLDSRGYQLY